MRINFTVGTIPLFWVDVPSSSQGVRFRSETARAEADDHVEGVQELRPPGLSPGEEFGGGEVL